MKIDSSSRTMAASAAAASAYARRAEAVKVVEPPVTVTSVMGIPEEEFTPRVREAITTLMQEVADLRRQLDETKGRLEEVEKDADQDQLLPLFNRRAFVRELTRSIGMAARYGTPSSLIYFDLDDFKQVNDTYGHAAGDAVLAHFSTMLREQVRDSDVVARIGGDEFGVILTHASEMLAHKKAASLAETLNATPARWQDTAIPVHFSYGTFELIPGEDAASAIARADRAMYAHKKQAAR